MINNYFINFDKLINFSVQDLLNEIDTAPKKVISEIKLIDLIFEKQSMTGVYVIFNKSDQAVYVGKTGSRAILERLAAHFDLRPNAFMNSFICALAGKRKRREGPHATAEELQDIYENALTHKLLFIQIPNSVEHKSKIGKIESILRRKLNTSLNSNRGQDKVSNDTLIQDL
ncbi:hypothetical protein [Acinetobacter wuhouensis]|uniref:GIY-YIG domain-containing protein n=1 Tax=Acinetobacter wuhouensis TaxID=1879050 RepID=A0A4Q7AFR2_9GAMM|nr:hypothetical protein [Acinetobacter wuhouensis]RZG44068.1 hypothetical protein EXU28_15945 [Acinetobacter wuhouensis]